MVSAVATSEKLSHVEPLVAEVCEALVDIRTLTSVPENLRPVVLFLADEARKLHEGRHHDEAEVNAEHATLGLLEKRAEHLRQANSIDPEIGRAVIAHETTLAGYYIEEAREVVQKMREGWEIVQAIDSGSNWRFAQTKQPVTRRRFSEDDEFNRGLLKALKESADIHIKGMTEPFDEAKKTLANMEKLRKEQEASAAPKDEQLAQKISNEKTQVRKLLEKLEPWSNHISTDYAKNRVALGDMNTGQFLKHLPVGNKKEDGMAPQRHIVIVGEDARRFFHEQFGIGEAVERSSGVSR